MMWNEEIVRAKIQAATTGDLLDRITAYRKGMEPTAVAMIESELHRRGVTAAEIAEHRERCEKECVYFADGTAAKCSFCDKPAVREGWGWQKIMRTIPVFPRWLRYCRDHSAT